MLQLPIRLSALALLIASAAAAVEAPPDARDLGREMTDRFRAGEIAFVWQRMTPTMKEVTGSEAALGQFRQHVVEHFGLPTALVEETVKRENDSHVYVRVERFDKTAGEVVTLWAFDADGRIGSFFIGPKTPSQPAESPHLEYQTKNRLRLPFDGKWFVFWGGRELEQNYHVVAAGQRFAYDFLVVRDGLSHRGDGQRLADYHCWGRPILAPATGDIVAAIDGLPDQRPGVMDPSNPLGNHVILDLGEGEYALFGHLRKGSVRVAKGERVVAGQPLGRCGNSGNTTQPHLHFHLQDGPVFGRGHGLPIFFTQYLADGEPVERGEPVRGQTVEPRVKK